MKKEKILSLIKLVLFIGMVVLTYFISDKFIDYVLTIDVQIVKRVVNMILILIVTAIYFKEKKK